MPEAGATKRISGWKVSDELSDVYGGGALPNTQVNYCVAELKCSRVSLENEQFYSVDQCNNL